MSLFRVPSPVAVFECGCSETVLGQSVFVVGSCSELGQWNVVRATALITSAREFPLWRSCVFHLDSVKPGDTVEFKFFVASNKEGNELARTPKWETCCNRRFRCPKPGQLARVVAKFGPNSSVAVSLTETSAGSAPFDTTTADEDATLAPMAPVPPPPPPAPPSESSSAGSRTDRFPAAIPNAPSQKNTMLKFEAPVNVMARLAPSDKVQQNVAQLIAGHKHASSLRERLNLVRDILGVFPPDRLPPLGNGPEWQELLGTVAAAGVYLKWVATGVIPCHEDGRHYRPNAAAVAARDIVDRLENWTCWAGKGDTHCWEADVLVFFCRRLFAYLPSFSNQFACSVPLTRIRDIAHRNDIPQDLKHEIKTRLQNKLHRCAGPEDLQTCEELLARFQANRAAYSEAFVHEFEVFREELVDFFNARSLADRLRQLRQDPGLGIPVKDAINHFLEEQYRNNSGHIHEVAEMLGAATDLRFALLNEIGAADEGSDLNGKHIFFSKDPALGQQLRIADEQAANYVFMLMSRAANELDKLSETHQFDQSDEEAQLSWIHAGLIVLGRALHNLAASGIAAHYCCALRKEVVAAARNLNPSDRYSLLHVTSIARRILRITQAFSDLVMTVITRNFTRMLGQSFDVPDMHMATIYAEGEVRASVAFQTSRAASSLLRLIEVDLLRQSPFTVICDGEAQGLLMTADDLETFEHGFVTEVKHLGCLASGGSLPLILFLRRATGDEELEGVGQRLTGKLRTEGFASVVVELRGLLVSQDIPVLSHLGVRARQAKLPFLTLMASAVENEREFTQAQQRWGGQTVSFSTRQPRPFSDAIESQPISPRAPSTLLRKPSVLLRPQVADRFQVVFGSGAITRDTCGAKAATCQTLFDLISRAGDATISAPRCLAIPFGGFEATLNWQDNAAEAHLAIRQLTSDVQILSGKALTIAAGQLQSLVIDQLEPNADCVKELRQQITDHILRPAVAESGNLVLRKRRLDLMVRSSSNVEDTLEMSGAGLHESYTATVTWNTDSASPSLAASLDVNDVWRKIKMVWASLYTERAILARRSCNVKGSAMAVLIQPLVAGSWSFVAHTQLPKGVVPSEPTPREDYMYAELAKGMGEALAGGAVRLGGGRATRLVIGTSSQAICHSLWDFWGRLAPPPAVNQPVFCTFGVEDVNAAHSGELRSPRGSGSAGAVLLSRIREVETPSESATNETTGIFWQSIADKLRRLKMLDSIFCCPQDIEGCLTESQDPSTETKIYQLVVVQSRPQCVE